MDKRTSAKIPLASTKNFWVKISRISTVWIALLSTAVPEVVYDPISRILKVEKPGKERKGYVAVCTGGTADIPVAEEAAQTAEYFGCRM